MLRALLLLPALVATEPRGMHVGQDGPGPTERVPAPAPAAHEPVLAVLRALQARDESGAERAIARLATLGPRGVPLVVDVLCGRVSSDTSAGPLLDSRGQRTLHAVLVGWPRERVLAELRLLVERASPTAVLIECVDLTALLGGTSDFGRLLERLTEIDTRELRSPLVRRRVEGALRALLVREPGTAGRLRPHLAGLSSELLVPVARALAAGGAEALPALADLAHGDPGVDAAVLQALAAADTRALAHGAELRIAVARELVDSDEPRTRRAAAAVLGRLHDTDSCELLLALLEDGRGSRAGALEGLRALSGLGLPADPQRWRDWYDERMTWLELRAPELAREARGGSAGAALSAVRELSSVPLFRRELSLFVSEGLAHRAPAVAVAACQGLARLGEPTSLPTLIDALDDPRRRVREAAHSALGRWTGVALDPDPDLWYAWLDA